jgi:hypothetical protein
VEEATLLGISLIDWRVDIPPRVKMRWDAEIEYRSWFPDPADVEYESWINPSPSEICLLRNYM